MKKSVLALALVAVVAAQPVYAESVATREVAQTEHVNENGELVGERQGIFKEGVKYISKKIGEYSDAARKNPKAVAVGVGMGAAKSEVEDIIVDGFTKIVDAYDKYVKKEQTKDEKIKELEERIKRQEDKEMRDSCRQCARERP